MLDGGLGAGEQFSGCLSTARSELPSVEFMRCRIRLTAPEAQLSNTPVAARQRMPRPGKSWLGRGVLIAGLAMVPWVFILACSLPSTTRAAHWSTAWAGLDGLEAVGLMTTGVALIRGYSWLCLPAAVTSTLLVVDAWFDVATSAPGPAVGAATAMAVFPELPMAGLCAVLAIRNAPGRTRHRADPMATSEDR